MPWSGRGRFARGADGSRIEEMEAEPTPADAAALAALHAEDGDPLSVVYEGGIRGFLEDAEAAFNE